MSDPPNQKNHPDAREDKALEWLTLLTSGEVTTEELNALAHWRAQSPLNETAFAEAAKLWRSVEPAVASVAAEGGAGRPAWPSARVGRRMVLGGAFAAGAGYVIVQSPFGLWPSLSELTSDYRTGPGQQQRIIARGGARIDLNTRTSVDLRQSAGGAERIELITGEVSIVTAPKASQATVALAGNGRATATNATFNMRRTGSSVCVTCVAGSVLVEQSDRGVTIQQKQQVSYTNEDLGSAIEIDPTYVTAWQKGVLVFHDEPLGRVIEEVNRYWSGWIVVTNDNLKNRLVTARFKLDRLEDVITQVRLVFHANVTRLPGGIVLLSA